MPEKLLRALIVDNNNARGTSIERRLKGLQVETGRLLQLAVHDEERGGVAGNFDMDDSLNGIDLLFIHLGYPETQRLEYPGGNVGSMEFLLDYEDALQDTCIVAYTGGSIPAPALFVGLFHDDWHVHVIEVMRDVALHIPAFVTAWRREPALPPPVYLLKPGRRAPIFATAVGACQGGGPRSFREWRDALGTGSEYEQLLKELAATEYIELHAIALRIEAVLSIWQCAPDALVVFDADLDLAIAAVNPWPLN